MSKSFNWCLDKTKLKTCDVQVFYIGEYGRYWYLNDKLHRENGPAIERTDGTKYWYLNDKLHRENGPAIERTDGTKHWYLNDKRYSESDYWKELQK